MGILDRILGAAGGTGGHGTGGLGGSTGGLGGPLGGVLGGALGGALGSRRPGAGAGGPQAAIVQALIGILAVRALGGAGDRGAFGGGPAGAASGGGVLGSLLDSFRRNGRERTFQSWVGTGANEPVDADAVEQVLGSREVDAVAQWAGVDREEARRGLAEVLPELVDRMTPEGQVPSHENQVHALEVLAKRLGVH